MDGTLDKLNIAGIECFVYLPPDCRNSGIRYPVIYMNGGEGLYEIMDGVEPHFNKSCEPFIIISLRPENWNVDFTPWPAPALTVKDEPFGGRAKVYLDSLETKVKPYVDSHWHTKPGPEDSALIGYSLGGLTALFALYVSTSFGRIASISGSLWFDGWVEFMAANNPARSAAKVYLSLGKGEERSRNPRMAAVGDCTRKSADILRTQLSRPDDIKLEWNDGGHFTRIPQRIQKGILWLMDR